MHDGRHPRARPRDGTNRPGSGRRERLPGRRRDRKRRPPRPGHPLLYPPHFAPDGTLAGLHRKLKPTAAERLIWGEGDGSTLPVLDTPFGKVGGLICWENYMPLARMAMYGKGVEIYLAPTADSRDRWQATLRAQRAVGGGGMTEG